MKVNVNAYSTLGKHLVLSNDALHRYLFVKCSFEVVSQ